MKKNRLESDVIRTNLMAIEKTYRLSFTESDIAHLTQLFLENRIEVATEYKKI